MIHHSTKYQQNSITHFLNMHSTSVVETVNGNLFNNSISCDQQETTGMQLFQQHQNQNSNSNPNLIDLNGRNSHSIDGKSFTIAAILGLNNNNNSNRNFNEVVNLSLNQTNKLFERLPQIYNGGLTSTVPNNGSNNGQNFNNTHNHHHHPSTGHALKSLQQQFSQHINTDFVSREKYRNGRYFFLLPPIFFY